MSVQPIDPGSSAAKAVAAKSRKLSKHEAAAGLYLRALDGEIIEEIDREKLPRPWNAGIDMVHTRGDEGGNAWRKLMREQDPAVADEVESAIARAREARTRAGIEGRGAGIVGFVGPQSQVCPEFHGEPRSLRAEYLDVEPIVPEMIPACLRGWLADIARTMCVPIDYPAVAAIVALSSLVGRNLAIRPDPISEWLVVPNVWGGIVGPPGVKKSPATTYALAPINRLAEDAIAEFKERKTQIARDTMIAEAKAEKKLKDLKKAVADGEPELRLQEIAAEAEALKVEPPAERRYMVEDVTIEKLAMIFNQNSKGLLLYRDELAGFFRSLDQQGHEGDRGYYLSAWNGLGSTRSVDRVGRGTMHSKAPCLSIFGTIQPGPLSCYMKGELAGGLNADGMMTRFQLLVFPDIPKEYVRPTVREDLAEKCKAYGVFQLVDRMDPAAMGAAYDEAQEFAYLGFDVDAQEAYTAWSDQLEIRIRSDSESTSLFINHISKYRSLVPSLALLFHILDQVESQALGPVSLKATELAIRWCAVLETHIRRVHHLVMDGDPEAAVNLVAKVRQAIAKRTLKHPFTPREIVSKGWGGFSTVEDVRYALGILEDRNWARLVEQPAGPKGGRPSEQCWLHPDLIAKEGGASHGLPTADV
jgi:hypothetical protein